MPKIRRGTWMTERKLKRVREVLADCPDPTAKAAGLACLRDAKPGNYLCQLLPRNTPERIAAMRYIESRNW